MLDSPDDHHDTSNHDGQAVTAPLVVATAPPPLARATPALPLRTLADLLAEVILRGKSPETRRTLHSYVAPAHV